MSELEPGWSRVKFGEVVERSVERIHTDQRGSFERFVGVDHLDSDDLELRQWGKIGTDEIPPTFRFVFRKGTVLFPTRRPALRKCARMRFDGLTGEKLLVLTSTDPQHLDPAFLAHLASSPRVKRWAIEKAIGSVTPHFRWSDLAECEIALPPLEAQARAAHLLDHILELDEALREAEVAGVAQERSLLNDHFLEHNRPGLSVLDFVQAVSGGTPARGSPEYWNGSVPWLSPKDMKSPVLQDTSEHITEAAVRVGHALAPAGTVFVVVRGMILQHTFPVCWATIPMSFNQDVKALVPQNGTDGKYLALWFRWAAPHLLRLVSETSHGTKRLESDRLSTVPFSGAPMALQRRFVSQVESLNRASHAIRARRQNVASLRLAVLEKLGLS